MEEPPTHFQRLRDLCQQARGLEPKALDALLERECADGPDLAAEVRRLVAADASGGDVLEGAAADAMGLDSDGPAPVTLTELDTDASDGTWDAFLDQVRSRGPAFSRYDDHGEIARGGMGAIRRVHDHDLRRALAMKVNLAKSDDPAASDASLGRFLEEAQITAQLDHPGIVPIHEVGVGDDGQVYFTMKLVKGEDLRAVYERVFDRADAEWTITRALTVLLRVCEAMAYAHDKGVIHRDLKPANVMVGKYGEAYVMDWGLAKVLHQEDPRPARRVDATEFVASVRADAAADTPGSPLLSTDGSVVGTPAYMPPEQALGDVDSVGPPADVYAVGAMLYHLLAGGIPYADASDRRSAASVLQAVATGAPRPLAERAPSVPSELTAIVDKAMARPIPERYPDMTALARDLRAYLEGRVVTAHETGAWAELRKWVQRNRALAATAAAALLVVAALTAFFVQRLQRERNVAMANEAAAEEERDRVLRLSDKRRLDVLVAEADVLWPAHPENLDALRDWCVRAERLLARLPLHEESLAEVRAIGAPVARDGAGEERDYDFGADDDAQWWHDAVRDLVDGLRALEVADLHGATVAGLRARAAWAAQVEERTTIGPDAAAAWVAARDAIRAHSMYGGLDLAPQLGLVPLGPDPSSMLWEFGLPQSGTLPARDPATGTLALDAQSALVFVLIPGGTYRLGAQAEEASAPHYDPEALANEGPVRELTLAPYFLSKLELTQGQWERLTGDDPSYYGRGSDLVEALRHPVENVDWVTCGAALGRFGLVLPTEAQWEAGCRAGTTTPWSTGAERRRLDGATNLADQAARRGLEGPRGLARARRRRRRACAGRLVPGERVRPARHARQRRRVVPRRVRGRLERRRARCRRRHGRGRGRGLSSGAGRFLHEPRDRGPLVVARPRVAGAEAVDHGRPTRARDRLSRPAR